MLLGAALALPIVVLVVLQLVLALEGERERIEQRTLNEATQIVNLVDAQVRSDLAVMRVLATADDFERRNWPAAFARTREIAALNRHWRNVIVSDLEAGREVFSLARPYSSSRRPIAPAIARRDPRHLAGEVVREGDGCPCVYLHYPFGSAGRYLVTVALEPRVFLAPLRRNTPAGAISGLVDRRGNFIVRSRDQAERVGAPGTQFLRDAVASDEAWGIYQGRTYEGLDNHTAYYTSPLTRWSAHIAIPSSLIDRPRTYSLVASIVGGVLALSIAALLIAWALRDLAQRRAAEERLAQTQKLEAIGQLTGGVAHDFNNLLTVIIGGLNMLLKRIDDPKQRQIAEHMLESAKRGDKLTKQLLAFSRGKQMELAPVDLLELAPGMEELLRRSIEAGQTLEIHLDPEWRWVRSDANQLELAILNLVINARDAMPNGGRIEIASRKSAREGCIELSVSDTGMGMPKDVIDRALEPFFTTKPAGKGTGLGLSQVFGAAQQSGGSVEIDSVVGRGTTVRMILPQAEPPRRIEREDDEEPDSALSDGASRSILVVDDEPGVRSFMADALRDAGFKVTEAAHAGDALKALESERPILLVTDYSMPGMTGLELGERARAQVEGLRVLIVSGYADADAIEASPSRPTLLRKPFDEHALLQAVRDVLAA
ncbi:MAG TPA: ATP-binding protein [Vitreimonas sp.]|uniref:ATP-binding protein n=1 Tax=Vitreimonas sp. TaxID=3069702 RepID=UPI002D7083CC|nr:ATP-binding protein [Vitreimonas sp.]HYD88651.1 ATP-binding protein [Vitreimonas sp.]